MSRSGLGPIILGLAAVTTNLCCFGAQLGSPTPLTSVGAVSNLEAPPDPNEPGIGGGIDHVSYFRNRFIPQLTNCTQQVVAVYREWAGAHALQLPLQETQDGNVLMHATRAGLDGLFELTYRVDTLMERARFTVYYYSADGARLSPLAIPTILEKWDIAALQDSLDGALSCGNEKVTR